MSVGVDVTVGHKVATTLGFIEGITVEPAVGITVGIAVGSAVDQPSDISWDCALVLQMK